MTMPSSFKPVNSQDEKIEPKFPSSFKPVEKKEREFGKASIPGMPKSFRPIQKLASEEQFISDEELEKEIERAQGQMFSRLGEAALGAPGDIASFFTNLLGYPEAEKYLPTSRNIRKAGAQATGGYFEPKTPFEEGVGEFISDVGSASLPLGGFKAIRALGVPLAGSLAKEGLKYGSADEQTQAYGKIGSMVITDLLTRRTGGAKKYASDLFRQADEALPKGLSFDASKLSKSLDRLEDSLREGGSRSTTKKALEKIQEIKSEIKDGRINAQKLAAFRPSINEAIEELGGFNIEVPRKLKPRAIGNLNDVKKEVIQSLDEYAGKYNPEYKKLSRDANEAWAAYQKSNRIHSFLEKKVPYALRSPAAHTLFSVGAPIGGAVLGVLSPSGLAAGTAVGGVLQLSKVIERMSRSPALRTFYMNSLKEASAGNAAGVTKNLKAMDKELGVNTRAFSNSDTSNRKQNHNNNS